MRIKKRLHRVLFKRKFIWFNGLKCEKSGNNSFFYKVLESKKNHILSIETDSNFKFTPVEFNMATVIDKNGNFEYRKITTKDWIINSDY